MNKLFKGKNILLVEDEDDSLILLKKIFKDTKAKIFISKTGENTMDIVKTKKIDLVLMDYYLPYKNGLILAKEIKEIKDIPVILVTSNKDFCQNIEFTMMFNFNDVVCKPFTHDLMIDIMKKYIS